MQNLPQKAKNSIKTCASARLHILANVVKFWRGDLTQDESKQNLRQQNKRNS